MDKSDIRLLTEAIQESARELRNLAESGQSEELVTAYNAICGVLDSLNETLDKERERKIKPDWELLSIPNSLSTVASLY